MLLKTMSLTENTLRVVRDKGTEVPFTGIYDNFSTVGTYLCRQCGLALYRSTAKFLSNCGWASFDEEIDQTILYTSDKDGRRVEILCARCQAHLGHVFYGENYTKNSVRHCVNSVSLDWVEDMQVLDTEEAIFAGGCFWGVEYYLQQIKGVVKTEVGFIGGEIAQPTYEEVCNQNTGHYEAVRVVYDINKVSYENVTKFFFEIHDPTQVNGQGPDKGQQYQSAIFYYNDEQRDIVTKLIHMLESKGYKIATQMLPMQTFWPAEIDHQQYYTKTQKRPYCHQYVKRF